MKMVDTKSAAPEAPFRVRTNPTGRRTYSREYKLEVVNECTAPGASLAAVAMAHRINANLVRRWVVGDRAGRLAARPNVTSEMLPVTVTSARVLKRTAATAQGQGHRSALGVIEVELNGACIRVRGAVDAGALRTILDMLTIR
jgi:transposase